MKEHLLRVQLILYVLAASASGQGTFIYDQQSSTDEVHILPGETFSIQSATPPWGQSFTPSLSPIGFIRLGLDDGNVNDGLGATVYVNLVAGSIGGTVIASTMPITMPNNFAGFPTFYFPTAVSVKPGVTYYFTPVVQSGGTWDILSSDYNYQGGSLWENGTPALPSDLWFREGVVTPEPSPLALLSVGTVAYIILSRRARLRHASA